MLAPPSARCNFFKCAPPPNLKSWNRPCNHDTILYMSQVRILTSDGFCRLPASLLFVMWFLLYSDYSGAVSWSLSNEVSRSAHKRVFHLSRWRSWKHPTSSEFFMLPLVEQELLTHPEHPSSPQVFSGFRVTRSFVLCVYFVDRCLSFCTIVLSVLLRLTDHDYHLVSSNSSWLYCRPLLFWLLVFKKRDLGLLTDSFKFNNKNTIFLNSNMHWLISLWTGRDEPFFFAREPLQQHSMLQFLM
jgi:hypothetical protein